MNGDSKLGFMLFKQLGYGKNKIKRIILKTLRAKGSVQPAEPLENPTKSHKALLDFNQHTWKLQISYRKLIYRKWAEFNKIHNIRLTPHFHIF